MMSRRAFNLLGALAWAALAVINFREGETWYGIGAAFIAGCTLAASYPLFLYPVALIVHLVLAPVRAVARGRRRRDLAGRSIPVADHRGPIVTRYDIDGRPRTDWSDNT